MPTGTTKLANMINPEVMADMVSAKLPKLLKFTPLAYVETALEGQPGSVLTVPAFEYAGDATDVAEGEAIPLDQLTTKKTTMTIKKAGKGYEITDEAVLSGLGDPIGQATYQLGLAIANKIDNDIVELAKTATQHVAEAPTTLETIDKALQIFEDEEDVRYVAVINPKDAISLKANIGKEWVKGSELGAEMVVSGTFGEAGGVQIVRSKKVEQGKGFLVQVSAKQTDPDDEAKYGAFVINLKRNVAVETDRDIIKKTTVITGDEHYGVYLYDQSKVVKFGESE
ncbi:N4-gp56 family major capsid protein [Streptococcus gallolyticus]|uniref:N4-gp56 family major capsid protein n=1 Tax=Streptococcus gallolyticus TaxID=315405 RepID=UPI002284CE2C|nr:N4-gp56 family major capsid protein [Streptococcus gallolyticus]MCY7156693.1 N4-gp56 family major capsid protein [Streptococcus gallolyticus subsp. gallolyticus]